MEKENPSEKRFPEQNGRRKLFGRQFFLEYPRSGNWRKQPREKWREIIEKNVLDNNWRTIYRDKEF